MASKSLGSNEVDLSTLTLAGNGGETIVFLAVYSLTRSDCTYLDRTFYFSLDVFPPDDFVKQLIQQRKLNVTLDETKDLIQTMIDVLPLRGDDPKRVQAEKEFWNGKAVAKNTSALLHIEKLCTDRCPLVECIVCKKKNLSVYELGSWSMQYTRGKALRSLNDTLEGLYLFTSCTFFYSNTLFVYRWSSPRPGSV